MRQIRESEFTKLMELAAACRDFRVARQRLHAAHHRLLPSEIEVRNLLDGGVSGRVIAAIEAIDAKPDQQDADRHPPHVDVDLSQTE